MAKAKILIVDDNPDIIEMITLRLKGNDYEVIGALNGQAALEKAAKERPDLILLDISMPGMDGFVVGGKLKEDIATKDIPIIMVTAKGEHKDVLRALSEVGAVDYVIKPFRPDVLFTKIKEVLEKKR